MPEKQKFQVDYGFKPDKHGKLSATLEIMYADDLKALKKQLAAKNIKTVVQIWSYTDCKSYYYKPRIK